MYVSYFQNWKATVPDQASLSWENFVLRVLGNGHRVAHAGAYNEAAKKATDAFSPVEYAHGTTRGSENVVCVSALGLDYDGISDAQAAAVLEFLKGVRYVLYTSYSHAQRQRTRIEQEDRAAAIGIDSSKLGYKELGERLKANLPGSPPVQPHRAGCWSFRIIVALDKPVPADTWLSFWSRMQGILPVPSDTSCKDTARLYGMPRVPGDDIGSVWFEANEGAPIPVDQVLALPLVDTRADDAARPKADKLDRKYAQTIAGKLAKSKFPDKAQLGRYLTAMLKGDVWTSVKGQRHETMLQMTMALERELPTVSALAIAELFRPAMMAVCAEDPEYILDTRLADAERATEEARTKRLAAEHRRKAEAEVERKAAIRIARGDGKDEAYTDEDLVVLSSFAGCLPSELEKKWIIYKDTSYYVLTLQGYRGPHKASEVRPLARDYLTPAGIECYKRNDKGDQVLLPLDAVLQRYGSVFEGDVIADMTTHHNYVDSEGTLHEACCKLRDVEPVYDAQIEEYLTILGGQYAGRVKDWMATVGDLSNPTCALYMWGVSDTGKSLLPTLVGRLFRGSAGPTAMSSALHGFNSALTRCPIVNANECWPMDQGRTPTSAELRDFITADSRPLRRKGIPEADMRGCIRLIVGANSLGLLAFSDEDLTPADRAAVNQRFLTLNIGQELIDWFAKNNLDRASISEDWIKKDRFARHVAWLRQNRVVKGAGKLIVEGNAPDFAATAATSGGLSEDVCQWMIDMVLQLSPGKGFDKIRAGKYEGQLFLDSDGLWVSTRALSTGIEQMMIRTRAKTSAPALAKVLQSLTHPTADGLPPRRERVRLEKDAPAQHIRFRRVRVEFLMAFMETHDYGDPRQFTEILANWSSYQSNVAVYAN
jgi:hypothetical protein